MVFTSTFLEDSMVMGSKNHVPGNIILIVLSSRKEIVVYLTSAKKAQFTHKRVEYNVFLFDEPLKGSKSLKIFKISLTLRFDKLWHLSKSVHTGQNSRILTVSNKKVVFPIAAVRMSISLWNFLSFTTTFVKLHRLNFFFVSIWTPDLLTTEGNIYRVFHAW
jgi:hypothetical protein